ncbi:hypothetical protein GCM10011575_00270 [Microlunatus endophyticus]|uniref:Nudix hydrolase domain-containing protein n=1 Tax=Microlunatus endophyticus TaxID=1716077 RepID=A0A917W079_9ACTN|nr:NUDIX domain-containing protein [Microlunatus endophyticus]GGL46263.1 hypothetical protein GCM10011575_00270 [Microlunatus endophyticus]
MRIVGQDRSGQILAEFDLGHGEDPTEQFRIRGFRTVQALTAVGADGDLTISWRVEPDPGPTPVPQAPTTREDVPPPEPGADGAEAVRRQRVAAYAWVESSRGILASEFYRPAPVGRWGLPGGGIDPGEEPVDAVHREVMEETSQTIDLGELVGVDTGHWIGHSPTGVLEDFHAVRIIYRAHCPEPTDPVVIDVGGTTSAATWFPYDSWPDQPWNPNWLEIVTRLFG